MKYEAVPALEIVRVQLARHGDDEAGDEDEYHTENQIERFFGDVKASAHDQQFALGWGEVKP